MRQRAQWVLLLLFFLLVVPDFSATLSGQSLGDLARQQSARKKAEVAARTQTAESPGVGVQLVIPLDWKWRDNPNMLANQLLIDCAPEHPYGCSLEVQSEVLPRGKTTITDADRKEWDSLEHFPKGARRIASRDFEVAARSAHEMTVELAPDQRSRHIYVLVPDGGRLYRFTLRASWDGRDHLEEYAQATEKVLQSISPLGQPSAEEAEVAETVAKFSPEERTTGGTMMTLLLMEIFCKASLDRYAEIEQVLNGCQSKTETEGVRMSLSLRPEIDPRRDPNYEYRLTPGKDAFELSALPRRAGLGGFFCDGKRIYFNPQGRASAHDKKIWDISKPLAKAATPSEATTQAAAQAPKPSSGSKKVWTEEELAGLRGPINLGTGSSTESGAAPTMVATAPRGESSWGRGLRERGYVQRRELKPEERLAHEYLVAISLLEDSECKPHLHRLCTLEELAAGIEVEPGRMAGFKPGKDPARDANFEYRLTIRDDAYEVSATPRRSGLGALFHDGGVGHYNPDGPATKEDPSVTGPLSVYHLVRR